MSENQFPTSNLETNKFIPRYTKTGMLNTAPYTEESFGLEESDGTILSETDMPISALQIKDESKKGGDAEDRADYSVPIGARFEHVYLNDDNAFTLKSLYSALVDMWDKGRFTQCGEAKDDRWGHTSSDEVGPKNHSVYSWIDTTKTSIPPQED